MQVMRYSPEYIPNLNNISEYRSVREITSFMQNSIISEKISAYEDVCEIARLHLVGLSGCNELDSISRGRGHDAEQI